MLIPPYPTINTRSYIPTERIRFQVKLFSLIF
uniref:Uncharacterized protein n=1 Tax=Myoviridae sp. ctIty1 TaxID=2827673 RepID=A0A8S5TGZ3_9CAUD|nr:MAG TPA: hypothetical protein [Myoviridae sp. ctIty1]